MTARTRRRGTTNTLLLVSILVLSALFQSEIGGPGTIYNSLVVALAVVFLLMNPKFDGWLVFVFGLPVAFLTLSVLANVSTLHGGGYRSAVATAIGYALFMLKPLPLHHRLLRRLITIFLMVGLTLSLVVLVQRGIDFAVSGYMNFNVNANSAALFFVQSIVLSLALVQGRLGWMLAVPFMVLMVTTGSRAGAICTAMILIGYSLFAQRKGRPSRPLAFLRDLRSNWKVWTVVPIVAALAMWLLPEAAASLVMRLEGNASRLETWSEGAAGIDSLRAFLVGYGPATLTLRTGAAPHNSYIEAVASSGIFFVVTTLIALWVWVRRMRRQGCWDMLWIVPPVLVWGIVETIIFNGIETLWMVAMLLGIVVRSRHASLDVSRRQASSAVSRVSARPRQDVMCPAPTSPIHSDA